MTGIFIAGALEVINRKYRDRIHSIYATSSGADVGAYCVSGQASLPRKFFLEHLAQTTFVRGNWLSYVYKVFFAPKSQRIPDFLDIDYVIETARSSDCALNTHAFQDSDIELFVKVIDVDTAQHAYLPTRNELFEKLEATSQCGPFTTRAITIDGRRYIDGDTMISDVDAELLHSMPDKKFIYIEPMGPETLYKALLYPFYALAALAIVRLYSFRIGMTYLRQLFEDRSKRVRVYSNVTYLRNPISASAFCTDKKTLEAIYQHGLREAEAVHI